jgi:RES domain-containing protein
VPEVTAYRLAAWDTPFWALPNRREGRYNRPDEGATQYLALHPMTAWAELLRFEEISTEEEAGDLRPPLWVVSVLLDDEPLTIDFETCGEFGLAPEDLVGHDYGPCQSLASAFRADPAGPRVLVVPSAALPGTRNVVILEPRVALPLQVEPVDAVDVPAALAAEDGRAPRGLVHVVHEREALTPHAELDAWTVGEAFEFIEPTTQHLRGLT